MLDKIWDFLVRFRTWVVNLVGAVLLFLPDLLSAPEIVAVIPADYQKYVLAAVCLLNIWMRPRPASRAADPEVLVKKAVAETDYPATIFVEAGGETKAVING